VVTDEDVRFYNISIANTLAISGNLEIIFTNLETDLFHGTPELFCIADGENIRFGGW
jgi:hypothetical protein